MEVETVRQFSFLIVAGGSGSRIGGRKKQFRLLDERPLWRWSADLALATPGIAEVILVLPEEELGSVPETERLRTVAGGATRPESVQNGLRACACNFVMVHDAARPFVGKDLLLKLMEKTTGGTGAVPVMPMAEAVLGLVEAPKLTVNRAIDLYWGYAEEKTLGKSADQVKRMNVCTSCIKAGKVSR